MDLCMNSDKSVLKGTSFPPQKFVAEFDYENPSIEKLANHILAQEANGFPVYVIRNSVSTNICRQVKENFWSVVNKFGGDRNFDSYVSVTQVGATQFGKNGTSYLKMVEFTKANTNALFSGLSKADISKLLLENFIIEALAKRGIIFRPSQASGRSAGICTARVWSENDYFALKPHEDLSQLSIAASDGFEICKVTSVISYNFCVSNDTEGKLFVWNIDPDLESKQSLGLVTTGYPYDIKTLSEIDCLKIDLMPGDAYFLRANFVHAVSQTIASRRITLGRFMGIIPNCNDFVYWT